MHAFSGPFLAGWLFFSILNFLGIDLFIMFSLLTTYITELTDPGNNWLAGLDWLSDQVPK